jgi:uncharacterized BrkB/YihY/UPF0761 family membrane protein
LVLLIALIVIILVVRFVPDWNALGIFNFSSYVGTTMWNWVGVVIFILLAFAVIYRYAGIGRRSRD